MNQEKNIDNFFFNKNILERSEAKFVLEEIAKVYNSSGGFSRAAKWHKTEPFGKGNRQKYLDSVMKYIYKRNNSAVKIYEISKLEIERILDETIL